MFFGPFQVVQVMLDSQCDPDPRGVYGKTPAHCAVERGSIPDSVLWNKNKAGSKWSPWILFSGIILIRLIWRNCLKLIFAFMFQSPAKVFSAGCSLRKCCWRDLLVKTKHLWNVSVKFQLSRSIDRLSLLHMPRFIMFHQSSNISIQVALAVFWPRPWSILQTWSGDGLFSDRWWWTKHLAFGGNNWST